jgi:DNA-binding NarL/FixJ family response regulator
MENYPRLNANGFPSFEKINKSLLSKITRREFELLMAIDKGKSNQQLSDQFYISINTVKVHLKHCYLKLEVNSRVEALSRIRKLA